MMNLTPWNLVAYEGPAHWQVNSPPIWEWQYATKKEAEETAELIKRDYPRAYIEIWHDSERPSGINWKAYCNAPI